MFCLFSNVVCFWLTLSFILILFILLGKPGKFLLDINPIYLRLPLPNVNDRSYTRNKRSVDGCKCYKDKIINPKSLAIKHDDDDDGDGKQRPTLFTGSQDGHVYRVDVQNDRIESIAHFPNGKALGMRIHKNILYFIEANSGVYAYDIDSGCLKRILEISETKFLDGRPSKFLDDLVVAEEQGDVIIYLTDVSRKFSMDMWCYVYLEPDSSGRILKFNTATGCVVSIIENLCFPNGIEITADNGSLLICELTKRRILQYKLNGLNQGRLSVLMDNLPGEPENIRKSQNPSEESYWIGLALTRDYNHKLSFLDDYSTEPNLRKLILRSCYLLGTILLKIGHVFGNEILKIKGANLKTGLALILDDFLNNPGMAIEMNLDGQALLSFQINGDVAVVSEIQELPRIHDDHDGDDCRILYTTSSGGHLNRIVLSE